MGLTSPKHRLTSSEHRLTLAKHALASSEQPPGLAAGWLAGADDKSVVFLQRFDAAAGFF
jgi:hypothetical protein